MTDVNKMEPPPRDGAPPRMEAPPGMINKPSLGVKRLHKQMSKKKISNRICVDVNE